jgi:hypothetical protein
MHIINLRAALLAIFGVAGLCAVAAACLPDNPYQRWQLIEGTLYDNARWPYERAHFDPAPVDVAILGSSRARLGLSAPRIAATLGRLGQPACVANMAVIEDGRNIEWAIADQLLATKSPRVLVIAVNETPGRWGHPGFKYVAPASAIAWPSSPLLHNSFYDIGYLPYRQLRLFAASLWPGTFGLRTRFDPQRYSASRTDDSISHVQEDGKRIEMDRPVPRDVLQAQAAKARARPASSMVPRAVTGWTDADEKTYITAIADLARQHGTRLAFVFLPQFGGSTMIEYRDFYAQFGMVIDNGDLAQRDGLFQGWAHLNRAGAVIASDRVAGAIAPLLAGEAAATPDKAPLHRDAATCAGAGAQGSS